MRIANNMSMFWRSVLGFQALFLALVLGGSHVNAANPPSLGAPPTASNDPSVPPPMPPLSGASPEMGAAAGLDAGGKPEIGKSVSAMENKVTDSAKGVVKNLDASTDAMTLEDLNSARQTIARIDALIEIEKHLADLEKIRNDRTGVHSTTSFASVIPASALQPPPMQAMKPSETMMQEPPKPMSSNLEVSRITGSDGHYAAVLRVNGELKTFKVGDQISNRETVKYISVSSVVIDENGQSRTLHIKGVDAIYNAMR